jgi:hypothetical protein
MTSSDNFVVVAPTQELARAVLERAEKLRDEIAMEWLGQRIPPSVGTAIINVKIDPSEESGRTWPGADLRRPTYIVWLTTSQGGVTGALLAHEMTHVVLSTRFPGQLPPWANEGIASLRDGAERKSIRRGILAWQAETGNWPHVGNVLNADKIAAHEQADYALASSLVEFLLARADRATLLEFAVQGQRQGWDAAIKHYYQIDSVDALQQAWRSWAARQLRPNDSTVARFRPEQ